MHYSELPLSCFAEPTFQFTNDSVVSVNEGDGFVRLCANINFAGDLICDFEVFLIVLTDGVTCKQIGHLQYTA